jgi:hypothetical protein
MAGPRLPVSGPTFTPSPYGLWDAIQKPPATDNHWQNGITWEDRCSAASTLYDECIAVTGTGGSPTGQAAMSSTFSRTYRGATSFAVYAEFDASPVGLQGRPETVAEEALSRVEQYQVERAFWTGVAGSTVGGVPQTTVFPHLAAVTQMNDPANPNIVLQTAATQIVTGGDDAAVQLGNLEAQLADCYHGQGYIHMPPEALPTFSQRGLIEKDGDLLRTMKGNIIVVGDGYTGSSPAGVAASNGTSWIYATGAVFGYRASVPVVSNARDGFDRIENTYRMIAERVYVIGFECCHLATLVTLGVPT